MARTQNWEALHPSVSLHPVPGSTVQRVRISIPEEARNLREVDEHRLSWRSPSGTDRWSAVPLEKQRPGRYRGTIDPPRPGAYLEFRLRSTLEDGRTFTYYHVVSSSVPDEFRHEGIRSSFFHRMKGEGNHVYADTNQGIRALGTVPKRRRVTRVPFVTWPLGLVALAIVLEVYFIVN